MSAQPMLPVARDIALALILMTLACQAPVAGGRTDEGTGLDAPVAGAEDARPPRTGGGGEGGNAPPRDGAVATDGVVSKDSGATDSGGAERASTDSAPADGEVGGDAASDARPDSGTAGPAGCAGAALCEDFEGAAEGPYSSARFQLDGGKSANYTVTSEQKRSGQRAIKVQTDGAAGSAAARRMLRATIGDQLGGGKSVFSRVWMYFPQLPRVSRGGKDPHYRLVRSTETIAPKVDAIVSAGIVGKDRGRMLYFKLVGFRDCAADGAVLPANRWTCVELRSDPSGFQAWIDGQPIGMRNTVSGDQCWQKRERVAHVSFGFEMAAGEVDAPLTFYMDDLALSEKRVGCE